MAQKIFRNAYLRELTDGLQTVEGRMKYAEGAFHPDESKLLIMQGVPSLVDDPIAFKNPQGKNFYDFENAKTIFDRWSTLTPTQAADPRLWAFVCHTTFMNYLRIRRSINDAPKDAIPNFILRHWFVDHPGPGAFKANDLYLFWWGAYLTYDAGRADPYELTRELFSLLDYTRTLITGSQGRSRVFVHAVLEYVLDNASLFKDGKQDKVRLVMRRLNFAAGTRLLPVLGKREIKSEIDRFRPEIERGL